MAHNENRSYKIDTFLLLSRSPTIIKYKFTRINPFSTYVCTECIFDIPQFVRNKIFLKKLFSYFGRFGEP